MKETYIDYIQRRYNFPLKGFEVETNQLVFNGVTIQDLIARYGTPLKLTYLPQIKTQIQRAKDLFAKAFERYEYKGQYYFCYCTKCNHLYPVVNKAEDVSRWTFASKALLTTGYK